MSSSSVSKCPSGCHHVLHQAIRASKDMPCASRSSSGVPSLPQVNNDHIIIFESARTIKTPSVGQRTFVELLHQAGGFTGFFNHLSHTRRPPRVKISPVGMLGLLLGYHDIIIAWMTTEWVINASLTHLGFLQRPLRLQDHLQGLQHHQQSLQHLQQGGGIKIQSCGYNDLVNGVQGASWHTPTL